MTVGIVVVSHSPALAQAALDLASQMVAGKATHIALAAGTADGGIGTDATRIAAAIESVASPEGVLVIMDLGSAILSSEMALEFLADPKAVPVRLCPAPFVEGLLAAVVRAAGGASLAEVDAEARQALAAKSAQLGEAPSESARPAFTEAGDPAAGSLDAARDQSEPKTDEVSAEVSVRNPTGFHARPAAALASKAASFQSDVTVTNLSTGAGPVPAESSIMLMSLGAVQGNRVKISAKGTDATTAVSELADLVTAGFGEI